ncbi:MAG: ethanolamine utilization protein EutH [Tissierellia bacterium]|nr:ethanolamine utilization protein EutH [Tissierellia bacterium]
MTNIIIYIMLIFSIIAAIDRIRGNRNGLGEEFEKGFKAMGPLALTMIGIISLSPFISQILLPVLKILSKITGADPSIFISSILATDMGGYATSELVAQSQLMAEYSGLILASMLGATLSFTMPIALNLVSKEDFPYFTRGVLAGIVTIPLGMIAAGYIMSLSLRAIFINLVPVIILSIIIVTGLFKFPTTTFKVFRALGKGIVAISSIGLIISIVDFILGIKIIPNLLPFEEGLIIVGKIAVILSGAYPMFHIIKSKLSTRLNKITKRTGLNDFSILGLLSSLANCVPMLAIYDKMDSKGKVVNAAFAVSGAFVFGGQLGYVSGITQEIVAPFILSKLTAGISAIILANILLKIEDHEHKKIERGNRLEDQ